VPGEQRLLDRPDPLALLVDAAPERGAGGSAGRRGGPLGHEPREAQVPGVPGHLVGDHDPVLVGAHEPPEPAERQPLDAAGAPGGAVRSARALGQAHDRAADRHAVPVRDENGAVRIGREVGVGERPEGLGDREDGAPAVAALLEQERQERDPAAKRLGQRVGGVQVAQGAEDRAELVVQLVLGERRGRAALHRADARPQAIQATERVHRVERPLERQVGVVAREQLAGLRDEEGHVPGMQLEAAELEAGERDDRPERREAGGLVARGQRVHHGGHAGESATPPSDGQAPLG